ncbi:hypothetical protein P0243_25315, partial [Enterobacter cloacae]
MKQKFRATAISSNQLSFFSIFDIDEDEITQIVDSPKEHLNDAYTSGLNFKSDESNISEINYDSERRENHLYEKSKLLKNQILGNDSNLLIVFYVQIMPDDFVMQLHR